MSYTANEYVFSTTAPDGLHTKWVDTSENIYETYAIREYINGAWTEIDYANGKRWDNIGKIVTRGKPYLVIATGQSNIGGPGAPGGDTTIYLGVAAWDGVGSNWVVAEDGVAPFEGSMGGNWCRLTCAKIYEATGRSVRIIQYSRGGAPLNDWSGNAGDPVGGIAWTTLTGLLSGSGVNNADLMLWGHGESSFTTNPSFPLIGYYEKFLEFVGQLQTDGYLLPQAKVLMSGTGDPLGQELQSNVSYPDGAQRAIGVSDDLYKDYVDVIGVETDTVHFTPSGHAEIARRMFGHWGNLPKDRSMKPLGYGSSTAKSFLQLNGQKLIFGGAKLVNNLGDTMVDFGLNPFFADISANGIGQTGAGLYFTNAASNSVYIRHYDPNNSITLDGTRVLIRQSMQTPSATIFSGDTAELILVDVGTTGKSWRVGNTCGTDNIFTLNYDGTVRFAMKPNGSMNFGATQPVASARVQITSTTQGFLPPVMTTAQRQAISSPAEGLMVYDSDIKTPFFFNGTDWLGY